MGELIIILREHRSINFMWGRSESANSRSIFVRKPTLGLRVLTLGLFL